jgi:hypothetical protein
MQNEPVLTYFEITKAHMILEELKKPRQNSE